MGDDRGLLLPGSMEIFCPGSDGAGVLGNAVKGSTTNRLISIAKSMNGMTENGAMEAPGAIMNGANGRTENGAMEFPEAIMNGGNYCEKKANGFHHEAEKALPEASGTQALGSDAAEKAIRGISEKQAHGGAVGIKLKGALRLPNFLESINLQHLKLGYHYIITHGVAVLLIPLLVFVAVELYQIGTADLLDMWNNLQLKDLQFSLANMLLCAAATAFGLTVFFMSRRPVYLMDFTCYMPNEETMARASKEAFLRQSRLCGAFDETSLAFQKLILERSGLGDDTFLPRALAGSRPNPCMAEARKEAEIVMFSAIDELLGKTGVKPKDIGILIVNCSLFNPTPSLSAMIVNHYGLRGSIRSYNLGGMGCSAGVVSIDLAKDLLQIHGNSYALVVSTENITQNWYFGNKKAMLLPNCLFRVGGAAMLLTNKRSDRWCSTYELQHTVRTHKGADPKCYRCVYQEEDANGVVGVSLSKDLMAIAGDALKTNITTLGPLVLPLSEQILFFGVLVARKLFQVKVEAYIPDFRLAFEHFCIHAGGRAVIDELEKSLQLLPWHVEPSRMTLYRFGNTSSSSIWYELAYSEAKGRVKRGDRVWQIAFGSGFKCNSAVWRALRTIKPVKGDGPWRTCVDEMPVEPVTN